MPIIELDLLIAFINKADKHHSIADKIFQKIKNNKLKNIHIAVSALLEYELVHKSKGYKEDEIKEDLKLFQKYPNLNEAPITTQTLIKAIELRKTYNLTYFDSLHAATAIQTDKKIISTDTIYDEIPQLKRINPYKI